MNSIEIIILNFEETRRRSLKVWKSIPNEYLHWKPDNEAFSIIEMIRHVLEGEHLFHVIIKNRGNLGNYISPWKELRYSNIENEIEFASVYRESFMNMLTGFREDDLKNISINRSEVKQVKLLGDYLNRMVYHEAVHMGQMLGYLRMIGIKRPKIWD